MTYVKSDAILMCTGCPGVPARLETSVARTVSLSDGVIGVADDKNIAQPGFGACLAIPTAPKKCSPQLGEWTNTKSDVLSKGKAQLLFPNTITCSAGPGAINMTSAGQIKAREGTADEDLPDDHCGWQDCDKKHKSKPIYPSNGVVERKDLKSWIHPSLIYNTVYRSAPMVFGIKSVTASNYVTRRHHVIPVNVFNKLPKLSENLRLLGFDINNEILNGISLPYYTADIVWHDLQFHRGSHPTYDDHVKAILGAMEEGFVTYCKNDKQFELWNEVDTHIKTFREEIINWQQPLHSYSEGQRDEEFKQHSDAGGVSSPSNRKYYY
ncbi:MAG: AHH domain-containing protein [Agriterribacter sp.]